MFDNASPHDIADQQRPARPEPGVDDDIATGVGTALNADPADAADQQRDAPILDDTEPWP